MIKIQYALNKVTNQLVHVESDEIIKGINYQVECLCCEEPLVAKAKESEKVTAHFAHKSKTKCPLKNMSDKDAMDTYGETLLHRKAKEVLESEKEIYIPKDIITSIEKKDLNYQIFQQEKKVYLGDNYPIISVEIEKIEGNFKPDLKIKVKGVNKNDLEQVFELCVEIAVTHFVDDIKKNKIIQAKKNCVQINLKNFPREDIEDLDKVIREIKNPQRYELINFYFSGRESVQEKLNKEYLKQLEVHNQEIINYRENLIKEGLINSYLVNIKDCKPRQQANCLCCGTLMTKNSSHFSHPLKEKCIIFAEKEKAQVFDKYKEIKSLKVLVKYLEYLKNNNKTWKLPEQKIVVNKMYEYKGNKFPIHTLNLFKESESFQIKDIKEFIYNNKSLLSLELYDTNQNECSLVINFLNNHNDDPYMYKDDDVLNIKCFNISDIHSKDYFSLQKELNSWKNFNFIISEKTRKLLIEDYCNKQLLALNKKIENLKKEEELKELKRIKEERKKEEAKNNRQEKINRLYNLLDKTIESLYKDGIPLVLRENNFSFEYKKITFFKNNFTGSILSYEKKIEDEIPYYEIIVKDNSEQITLAMFISLDYFHDLYKIKDNIQYKCPIRYFDIESREVNENEILENIKNIDCCMPTTNQRKKLINAFVGIQIEVEKKIATEQEIENKRKIKELADTKEKMAKKQKEIDIQEQLKLTEKRAKIIIEEEEKKKFWQIEQEKEISDNLNSILNKKLIFTNDNKKILTNKITEVKINSKNELVSFNINKECVIFVLNHKDTNKQYLLLDEIIDKRESNKNMNIGSIFYNDIKNIESNLLLISKDDLKLQKIDLYKRYDKIRYYFLIIEQYKKALEIGFITKDEMVVILDYYKTNKEVFENRFIKDDVKKIDEIIEKLQETKKLKI